MFGAPPIKSEPPKVELVDAQIKARLQECKFCPPPPRSSALIPVACDADVPTAAGRVGKNRNYATSFVRSFSSLAVAKLAATAVLAHVRGACLF